MGVRRSSKITLYQNTGCAHIVADLSRFILVLRLARYIYTAQKRKAYTICLYLAVSAIRFKKKLNHILRRNKKKMNHTSFRFFYCLNRSINIMKYISLTF